jgi:hypothetical protein
MAKKLACRLWKVIDLKREMLRRGWAPSPKAVEASVKKLRELEKIQPVRYGYYELAAACRWRVHRNPRGTSPTSICRPDASRSRTEWVI